MLRAALRAAFAASFLLISIANALPHGDDESMEMDMGMNMEDTAKSEPPKDANDESPLSYFAYGKHSGTIMAHIALMIIAWCFVLPTGKKSWQPLFFGILLISAV
jgi:hypothetical protein